MVEFAKKVNYVWEQRKLDDWGNFYYGRSCPKWSVAEDATIPCIRYGELYTKFGAKIDKIYSYTNMSPENLRFSNGTEVLIPRVGEDPMDYNRCTWLSMPNVAIGEMISVFNTDNNPLFTATMFNATLQHEFAMRVEGGSVTNLYFDKLKNIEVSFPTKEEQEKIATYFDHLDHLITLHQRKIGIFIKKMPIDWEQRKFSELYAKSSEKNDGSIGMDKNITVATMQFKENVKVSTAEYLKTYYTFNLGDIAFEGHQSKEFRYGRFVENDIGNGIVSHIFAVFRPIREYDLYFWKYAINNETLMQRILSRSTKASTMMHDLVTKDFLNEMFLVPSFDEQRQIGVFLATLDHLITLHHRKCVVLRKMKVNDWEQRKLGKVLVSLQNNTLSRADLSNETGVAKNVHYGDVLVKFGEVLDVRRESLPMISDESVLTKYKASFLKNGDVIVADTAEDSTVGKCSEIAGLNDEVVLSGLHTIPYRPIEKFASGYLGYYLNSSAYHNQLIPLMQGIKVTSISKSAMQNTEIIYPKSVEEQGKIGAYFSTLDHLITLHHRECVILRKMKVNDWEQRKVSELCIMAQLSRQKFDVFIMN